MVVHNKMVMLYPIQGLIFITSSTKILRLTVKTQYNDTVIESHPLKITFF